MPLPVNLHLVAEQRRQDLVHLSYIEKWSEPFQTQLLIAIGCSDFLYDAFQKDAFLCQHFPSFFSSELRSKHYSSHLNQLLLSCSDEAMLMHTLRLFRRREMAYIAWRDLMSSKGENLDVSWSLEESLSHLSLLAETIIVESHQWLYKQACHDVGVPKNAQGEAQLMLIIAMGKLGGEELNFSSDIDLIFAYPENGETEGARRSMANVQFFTRLGQRLIKVLDQQTVDGFCYRVDLRLRPFGESGPLVMSFSALEDYYQEQGRDWERYAMVKARVMGKESHCHYQELRQMLRPFVFRRYIDFSAIQALRRMKSMIKSEVYRRGLNNNIKLGAGGIREIEFIAQVFQLIRGGREPLLRKCGLLNTLSAIKKLALLPSNEVDTLVDNYLFLRRLENVLQAINDKQTQTLPDNQRDRARLSYAMNQLGWDELYAVIQEKMREVHQIFESIIGDDEDDSEKKVDTVYFEIWEMASKKDRLEQVLREIELEKVDFLVSHITSIKNELKRKSLGPRGREALTRLMPTLFHLLIHDEDVERVLPRLTQLIQSIATRTTYLELLDENEQALKHLVTLCRASSMIAEQLARYPMLLDELLNTNQLYTPVELNDYRVELREYLARIPEDDMEQQMEALRQFKQVCLLRIAASDISGRLSLMKVSDHLTYLAEAIIEATVNQAWRQLKEKYGEPTHLDGRNGRGFAIIGYGKMGGWELGYHSDLDIVFTHDCDVNVYTNGKKVIDGRQFYLRLAQRIIHIFSARTASGILYEVDTRLRPSGESGLLVSTCEAFSEYQKTEAWTWEHQALVRARVIYGDENVTQTFDSTRRQVLSLVRDDDKLKTDVIAMRKKMQSHLGEKKVGRFMLKQDKGGIMDIEFLAQYLVLKYSHIYPDLTVWSDNIRIFESLYQQQLMDKQSMTSLINAYCLMRNEIHHCHLLGLSADVDESQFQSEREAVIEAWLTFISDEGY